MFLMLQYSLLASRVITMGAKFRELPETPEISLQKETAKPSVQIKPLEHQCKMEERGLKGGPQLVPIMPTVMQCINLNLRHLWPRICKEAINALPLLPQH